MLKSLFVVIALIISASVFASSDDVIGTVTDTTFKDEIKEGIVLVDFWASWCMPCRIQGEILKDVAKETKGYVQILKLDVDKNPIISRRFAVTSIPTLLLFNDGALVKRYVGVQQKKELVAEMKKLKDKK